MTKKRRLIIDPSKQKKPAKWMDGKELVDYYHVMAYRKGLKPYSNWAELITCRIWMSKSADGASPVYASVWIRDPKQTLTTSGSGVATGYGYNKLSQAVEEALENAGVQLPFDIGGRGNEAIRTAFKTIAKKLGFGDVEVVS
jgi:hypothetical protein